jgi:uncharacterized protein DUF5709
MDRDEYGDDDAYEQLDAEDTLEVGGPDDPLDEGYSPAERPWAVHDWGTTAREEATGESLDSRLAREVPDVGAADPADDGIGDATDTDGEPLDDEVGDDRSGRLVDDDTDPGEPVADDVGVDGAGASAEEAAVHTVRDDDRG